VVVAGAGVLTVPGILLVLAEMVVAARVSPTRRQPQRMVQTILVAVVGVLEVSQE